MCDVRINKAPRKAGSMMLKHSQVGRKDVLCVRWNHEGAVKLALILKTQKVWNDSVMVCGDHKSLRDAENDV